MGIWILFSSNIPELPSKNSMTIKWTPWTDSLTLCWHVQDMYIPSVSTTPQLHTDLSGNWWFCFLHVSCYQSFCLSGLDSFYLHKSVPILLWLIIIIIVERKLLSVFKTSLPSSPHSHMHVQTQTHTHTDTQLRAEIYLLQFHIKNKGKCVYLLIISIRHFLKVVKHLLKLSLFQTMNGKAFYVESLLCLHIWTE